MLTTCSTHADTSGLGRVYVQAGWGSQGLPDTGFTRIEGNALPYDYMYACFHDNLPSVVIWQERDEAREATITALEEQIAAFQVEDDDDEDEGQDDE